VFKSVFVSIYNSKWRTPHQPLVEVDLAVDLGRVNVEEVVEGVVAAADVEVAADEEDAVVKKATRSGYRLRNLVVL